VFLNLGAKFQPAGIVYLQYLDRGAPGGADADDAGALKDEMVGPSITPRMKKRGDLPGLRVDSCQVRPFMKIAAVASKCEIINIIGAAMLLRRDVLNVIPQAAMFLVQTAILATVVSPPAD
jgi:hypothetical protein